MTDVNDNSPVFIGAPYVLNISEVSLRGSVVFNDVLAVDVDQPGPFSTVQYNIEPGLEKIIPQSKKIDSILYSDII